MIEIKKMKIQKETIRHQSLTSNSDLDKIILNYLVGSLKARSVRSVATTCKSLYKLVQDTYPSFASLETIIITNSGKLCYPYLKTRPKHNERTAPGFGALIPIKDRESLIAGASLTNKPIENINMVAGIFRLLDILFMEQFDNFGKTDITILDYILNKLSVDQDGSWYGLDISESFDKCCSRNQPLRLSDKLVSLVVSKKDSILLQDIISTIMKHAKPYHENMPFLQGLQKYKTSLPENKMKL